jgi:EAL domain-containing protein (putative c-di-GMP-specific phosphodiesterase class I)
MDQHLDPDASVILRGNFDGICQQVRHALAPTTTQAVWLYGADGRLLWMTSSILGDEEAAQTALRAFSAPPAPAVFKSPVGRAAGLGPCSFVAFRAVDAKSRLVGVVMVVVKTFEIPPAVSAQMEKVLAAFAALRPMPESAPLKSAPPEPAPPEPAPQVPVAPVLSRSAIGAAKATPAVPGQRRESRGTQADQAQRELLRVGLALYVQRFIPLEKTTRPKRYELLWEFTEKGGTPKPEGEAGSLLDRRVFGDLIGWLLRHPRIAANGQTALSVKLSKAALYDPDFTSFVQNCLARAKLPVGMIGFEIPAVTPRKHVRAVTDLAVSLQSCGCFLVLDNFTLRTECFNALLLPGLRVIKLSHDMTARMYTDKIMRAAIPSITQMAKVLDVQTVVKRTRMAADLVRLSAYGLDYVQSAAIAPAMPIDALAKARPADSRDPPRKALRDSRVATLSAD